MYIATFVISEHISQYPKKKKKRKKDLLTNERQNPLCIINYICKY